MYYLGIGLDDCVRPAGPHNAHMHLVDAVGVDAEGLRIGEATKDFPSIAKLLSKYSSEASFIPEIWQGHKDNGAGFWNALHNLEKWKF